jgi:hypothetical protein
MEITGVTYSTAHYEHYNQNGDRNYFEEVIDKMILDGIVGMNETFRTAISNLSKDKKRMTILSLLDPDRNTFLKIKALIGDGNYSKADHIADVVNLLREYVKVAETLRRQYGEVMTPTSLITDMLNKLPKEVWSNPNLKWFDACNGVGPFICLVIYGLMKGLKNWEEDEEKRYKHIVENMIYSGEIQPSNVFLYMCAVDPKDEYKLNVYCGDFLAKNFDEHMKNVWGIENFDIIVGNPPYDKSQNADGKRGGGDTLWDKFVIKYINKLKSNGYLSLVHPTIWRKPQSERSSSKEVNKLMMSKQIHYLEMHDSKDGMKTFNAGTRYDFYVLENCDIYTTTKINDEDRIITNVDLKGYNFIPNKGLEFFNKILAGLNDEKCPVIFNRTNYGSDRPYVIEIQDDIHKYRLVHSTPKAGNRYLYSSRNDRGHFGIPKVIFGESGIYDVIIDMNGEYGMSQGAMAIVVSDIEEANNIKEVLLSDGFSKFLESVMWSNFRIDWRLFTFLKKDFWKEF